MITLRQDQEDVRSGMRVALRRSSSVLAVCPTGFGKCLGKDTPVMMFDGTVKVVQDVRSGDLLMGPDSKPRLVLSTCKGREMLYRVTPTKGDSYVVNESHILSLKMTGGSKKATGFDDGSIQNVEVRDYLSRSKTFKHCAKGWRVGVDFAPHDDALPIDPYFLGLWLGDGTVRKPSITTMDAEIAEFCFDFFHAEEVAVRVERNSKNSINLHAENPKGVGNPLKEKMRKLGVLMNKHIPHRYLTGSRDERLRLLAGIVDSDGHHCKNGGYEVTFKDERLFDEMVFLARSLGFSAYKSAVKKTCCNNGVSGDYFRCTISGDLDQIPVLVSRNKASPRRQIKNVLMVGIKVEPIGEGDYYGFEIDGDRLFLLGDFTVTHNTVLASALIKSIEAAGKRVIFCVHRIALLRQSAVTLDQFGIRYSYIAAGMRHNIYRLVNIASIDTLKNRLGKYPCDYLFIDEAHLSASEGWAAVVEHYRKAGAKIIGLTGTPVRLDGKPLGAVWDEMVLGPAPGWLIENGFLSRYRAFAPSGLDLSGLHSRNGDFVRAELEDLVAGKAVMAGAVNHWRDLALGKRTVAFAPSVRRAEELAAEFRAAGYNFTALDGNTPQVERDRAFNALADRKLHGIVNCNLFSEGFDMSAQVGRDVPIECVLDLYPTQSLARHLQKHGRGLRRKPEPAILLDLVGGFARLGLPDEEREWSLEGKDNGKGKRESGEEKVRQCPKCFASHDPAPRCPECGHVYEVKAREVKEVDGELEEIDLNAVRKQQRVEQGRAQTLEDLIKLGRARGHKHPEKWAAYIMTARMAKQRATA